MIPMRHPVVHSWRSRTGAVLMALVVATGCGWRDDESSPTSEPSAVPSTTTSIERPSTTHRTRPSTTTLPPLGVPAPPPAPGAAEPVVVLGSIEIPAIGVSATLYSGITLTTLDRGPGHWPGTAMPGQWGNTVVAGHRVSKSRPFHDLDQLVPGDQIIFTTDAGRFVYAVTGTQIVEPDALWITDQTYEHRATLFACHPPGSVSHRIVVSAELVDSA